MRAEDLKHWLERAEAEKKAERDGVEGGRGRATDDRRQTTGDMLAMRLFKHIWDMGEIPQKILLAIVVLNPKEISEDFRGIRLLKVLWKVIKRVSSARLKCVPLHNALHGFRPGAAAARASLR